MKHIIFFMLVAAILIACLCFGVLVFTVAGQPPLPMKPAINDADQWAINLLRSYPTNSEPYRLALMETTRKIEPEYFKQAILDMNSVIMARVRAGKIAANIGGAESDALMGIAAPSESQAMPLVIAHPPNPTSTNFLWTFTNRLESWKINIGSTLVENGVTNGWNIIDSRQDNIYPPFALWTALTPNGQRMFVTNWPAGTAVGSIQISSTNQQRYFILVR